MEKKPTPLSLDDVMEAIEIEPTMRIKMGFRKRLAGRQVMTPVMVNLKKAVEVLAAMIKETAKPGWPRVEKLVAQATAQAEKEKQDAEDLDVKILERVEKELEARMAAQDAQVHQSTSFLENSSSVPRGKFLSGPGQQLELPASKQHRGPNRIGPAVVKSLTSMLNTADVIEHLLDGLQIRTLCRMQMVSRQFLSFASPKSKQRIANFVYTVDSLESTVYSLRGRRLSGKPGDAKTRLVRFLTQPEYGPIFRHLDLHRAPAETLEDLEVHCAMIHMTKIVHVIYPKIGWKDKRLQSEFLQAIRREATKEAATPSGRST